jgi:hypothetical protein
MCHNLVYTPFRALKLYSAHLKVFRSHLCTFRCLWSHACSLNYVEISFMHLKVLQICSDLICASSGSSGVHYLTGAPSSALGSHFCIFRFKRSHPRFMMSVGIPFTHIEAFCEVILAPSVGISITDIQICCWCYLCPFRSIRSSSVHRQVRWDIIWDLQSCDISICAS